MAMDHLQKQTQPSWKQMLSAMKAINSSADVICNLKSTLDIAIAMVAAERGFVIMRADGQVKLARSFDKEWLHDAQTKFSNSIVQQVIRSEQPLIATNAQHDPLFLGSNSTRKMGLKSVMCLPLVVNHQPQAVLYLDNRFCCGAFSEECLPGVMVCAEIMAMALSKSLLQESATIAPIPATNKSDDQQPKAHSAPKKLVGCSTQMRELRKWSLRAAQSNVTLLITGESGTGKGLLAQTIHSLSKYKDGPWVTENCAAIADGLLESELFGYVRGAFTGAAQNKTGLIAAANGGTLFLDEIGDMSLNMQAKLLKALESGKIRPVGSQKWQDVQVRFIAATHRDLPQMIINKEFRQDLWYRLRVIHLQIPPLRERPQDIPLLVNHFLANYPPAMAKNIQDVEPRAMEMFSNYNWPGNVRQLEHEIKKIVVLKENDSIIRAADISLDIVRQDYLCIQPHLHLKEAVQKFEHNYIAQTLRQTKGNKTRAAQILGLSRRSLYNKFGCSTP